MSERGRDAGFDFAPGSTHNLVVGLVPPGARVLEFGCATGYMSEVLKSRLGCSVTGIERSPEAAALARAHCNRVVVGDAEDLDLDHLFGDERFDTILFADVLEHLREPGGLLGRIRCLLAESGAVVASIPNIAHGSVRLALLGGEFQYRDAGLLDASHLRFFTHDSIQDLFEGAGYFITHWLRRRVAIEQSEVGPPLRPVPDAVREWLMADPEVSTYQFVTRAMAAAGSELLHHTRTELTAAKVAYGWLQRLHLATQELARAIGPEEPFILVDGDQIRSELAPGHRAVPFPERDGQYGGPPLDDAGAIAELERLRGRGAKFVVVAWTALWWLEHYPGLSGHLRSKFRIVLENERLIVWRLT